MQILRWPYCPGALSTRPNQWTTNDQLSATINALFTLVGAYCVCVHSCVCVCVLVSIVCVLYRKGQLHIIVIHPKELVPKLIHF